MVLTGLIASELAGLTRFHIKDGFLMVRRSVTRGVDHAGGKTAFRRRDIRITWAIQQQLDVLMERTEGRRLVTGKTGTFFRSTGFYKYWVKAVSAAGVRFRVPYATRHTFAAWCLLIGITPLRLHKLMGQGSKKMVYEVYGVYVERLEEDKEKIKAFFGEDFTSFTE
jgi:integrase